VIYYYSCIFYGLHSLSKLNFFSSIFCLFIFPGSGVSYLLSPVLSRSAIFYENGIKGRGLTKRKKFISHACDWIWLGNRSIPSFIWAASFYGSSRFILTDCCLLQRSCANANMSRSETQTTPLLVDWIWLGNLSIPSFVWAAQMTTFFPLFGRL